MAARESSGTRVAGDSLSTSQVPEYHSVFDNKSTQNHLRFSKTFALGTSNKLSVGAEQELGQVIQVLTKVMLDVNRRDAVFGEFQRTLLKKRERVETQQEYAHLLVRNIAYFVEGEKIAYGLLYSLSEMSTKPDVAIVANNLRAHLERMNHNIEDISSQYTPHYDDLNPLETRIDHLEYDYKWYYVNHNCVVELIKFISSNEDAFSIVTRYEPESVLSYFRNQLKRRITSWMSYN